ncbi:hypothetical protein [Anaplasma phagocytophilum]|uniref:hypothetical protein n=1 Tax=Anaplasma phagocytophilum TaxID=948 RepID=UPI0007DF243C|nr:hypothetical protein [Anaplasma phagocytophilum]
MELAISDWVVIEAFYALISVRVFQDGNEVAFNAFMEDFQIKRQEYVHPSITIQYSL